MKKQSFGWFFLYPIMGRDFFDKIPKGEKNLFFFTKLSNCDQMLKAVRNNVFSEKRDILYFETSSAARHSWVFLLSFLKVVEKIMFVKKIWHLY